LSGAFVIDLERVEDERGHFARFWCRKEFQALGLEAELCQASLSYNALAGTLRGLHYQVEPSAEAKLVFCTRGSIFDVIVDLRAGSPTFCQHFAVSLDASSHRMLYVPRGLAHGFQTLEADTIVNYLISSFYSPEHSRGVRWNDPAFGIRWPVARPSVISERDAGFPDFKAGSELPYPGCRATRGDDRGDGSG
jgi:dTDP-4-dehydrorhamnose 3,5-epimerase